MANWISGIFGHKSASTSSGEASPPAGITQINDSVWELHRGSNVPNVEIIFFHGLQMGDYKNAFWKTWQSRDGSLVWPKEWLGEKFPDARILSVSYDTSAIGKKGKLDTYVLGENLVNDIILSTQNIGQKCPVILVGHSLGGIIIKQFVLSAFKKKGTYDPDTHQEDIDKISTFLEQNVKGVFYYSTPHHGSGLADFAKHIPGTSLYLELLKTLSTDTQRINEEFRQHRVKLKAKAGAIGESLPTYAPYTKFSAVVVEEASARSDIDDFYMAATNHFDVCKPQNKTTAIFENLCKFVTSAAKIQISEADSLSEQLLT